MITIWRIITSGLKSIWRNRWLSVSTVSIMTLTLVVFQGLIVFNVISDNAVETVKNKVDISVYFKSNVSEDSILDVKRVLEDFNEISSVEYVSRSEALDVFKSRHESDETITQTLEELDQNPLLASLNIKAQELNQYGTIASYLKSASLRDMVDKVTYAQNRLVIERLRTIVDGFNAAVLVLTIFLSILAVIITFNAISLAIFSNREQINIMRVVGASNKFIRGPYIVEGIVFGIVAAIISFIIFIPAINIVSPQLTSFIPDFNLNEYFDSNSLKLVSYQLIMGVALGIISSFIAIRRYLKA